MTAATARAEMEGDLAWRQNELRFLQNQTSSVRSENEGDLLRRSLVLLLYAHFEGYCKFALTVYANAVNRAGISCRDANEALAAATLADVLAALRHPSSKCADFRRALPDDSSLHLFAREREFIAQLNAFEARSVALPDSVVDTESNLKPIVLRKNLFRLGLDLGALDSVEGDIHRLLQMRNKIAHGESKAGIPLKMYEELREAAHKIMQEITAVITEAVRLERYRRPAGA